MFLCLSFYPGEITPVVSMKNLFDSISKLFRNQHSEPEVAVVVNHHLQLVLHHYGEVDPVLVVWLDEWDALLQFLCLTAIYSLSFSLALTISSQVTAMLSSMHLEMYTSSTLAI